MERFEKIGLGVALLGHAGLMGGFYIGSLSDEKKEPQQASISVNIVADIADISTAPDAIQEEPAPSEELVEELAIDEPLESEAAPEEASEPAEPKTIVNDNKASEDRKRAEATKKANALLRAEEQKKADAQKRAEAQKREDAKKRAEAKRLAEAKRRADAKARAEERRKNGFAGRGSASGTPASQSAAEVRRSVKVSLSSQVERYFKRCAPTGVDVNKITTAATLNLNKNGGLISITGINQRGINSSNRTQAGLHKECVSDAIRAAAPFKNLPEDNYAVWKEWPMEFTTK